MIDTHSHIQFKIFDKTRDQVIAEAKNAGVEKIIAVGTDLESSKKAVQVANDYPEVFASVGIHPHHVFHYLNNVIPAKAGIQDLEVILNHPKVVAIGETGMDKHIYKSTKYPNYLISEEFLNLQKYFFAQQIKLAIKYKKSLIIHNREAAEETLEVLGKNWDKGLERKVVFHMCEPNQRLLNFAIKNNVFISFGGDITYDLEKQEFLKKTPLDLLVLETDSPFFTPEPLKSKGSSVNTPSNLTYVLNLLAKLLSIKETDLEKKINRSSRYLAGV